MDKEKDILKEFFRDKLQDYAPPVKRDLWSSLESHVPAEKSLWRRIYPAVASVAAVLLIFILSYKYIFDVSPDLVEPISSVIENKDTIIQDKELIDRGGEAIREEMSVEKGTNKLRTQVSEERNAKDVAQTKNSGQEQNNVQEEFVAKSDSVVQEGSDMNEEAILPESGIKRESHVAENKENAFGESMKNNAGNHYTQTRPKGNGNKTQISFSGKGFTAMSNDLDYFKIYNTEYLSSYDNKFQIDELFLIEPEEKDWASGGEGPVVYPPSWTPSWVAADNYNLKNIKYSTPVSLSLYVSRDISSRWAIETGVSYTKLSSEEIWEAEVNYYRNNTKTDLLTNNVKLDYLGVPLRVSYYPIKKNRLFVYVSAGGMIEKCISGKVFTVAEKAKKEESTNLKISELQYSVTGGVGIGLQLFKPVSLFVEPGIIYYFDDGSDIMTIRKDKPFNYNIQGGLRLGF